MRLKYFILKANARFAPILLLFILIFSILFCTITVNACGHTVGTFEEDYTSSKTTFVLGETVYGKGTKNYDGYLKLRIRDPNNNVVFYSDPVYGKQITCLWNLNESAPLGVWNIQLGEFYDSSWNWNAHPERMSYFIVIEPTEYQLLIDIIGIGTVTKTPNQINYINGTVVQLVADPDNGWIFNYWEGDVDNNIENPTTIKMTSNKTVLANFKKKTTNNNDGGFSDGGSNEKETSDKANNGDIGSTEIENLPPIANLSAGAPYQGFNSSEIIFNGSLSYDPDGYISLWIWDFGDGTNGSGMNISHTYHDSGRYTVILTVTDDKGATNMSECFVLITQLNIPSSNPVNHPIIDKTIPSSEIKEVNELSDTELGNFLPLILIIATLILLILLLLLKYIKNKKSNNET
jgi:PKD repeat protein